MTEFINKNVEVPDASRVVTLGAPPVGGVALYSWQRVRAGGGNSYFSGLRMAAVDNAVPGLDGKIYDRFNNEILGGGGGGGDVVLPLTIWWQPGGTNATNANNKVVGNATTLNAFLVANPSVKNVYVDTSVTNPAVIDIEIDCDYRVGFIGYNDRANGANFKPTILFSSSGSLLNCPELVDLNLTLDGGNVDACLKYVTPSAVGTDLQSVNWNGIFVAENGNNANPYLLVTFNQTNFNMIFALNNNSILGNKSNPLVAGVVINATVQTQNCSFVMQETFSSISPAVNYFSATPATVNMYFSPAHFSSALWNVPRASLANYRLNLCEIDGLGCDDTVPQNLIYPSNVAGFPVKETSQQLLDALKIQNATAQIYLEANTDPTALMTFPSGVATILPVTLGNNASVRTVSWGAGQYMVSPVGTNSIEFVNANVDPIDNLQIDICMNLLFSAGTAGEPIRIDFVVGANNVSIGFCIIDVPAVGQRINVALKCLRQGWTGATNGYVQLSANNPTTNIDLLVDNMQVVIKPLPWNVAVA